VTRTDPTADTLLDLLRARYGDGRITHVEQIPARAGVTADWPDWVPEQLRQLLTQQGVVRPWQHQARAADLAWQGRHVVVATGTGSGKSLAYLLPALSRLQHDPRATVLYLAPTKALAADQLRTVTDFDLPGVRAGCYDGDTPREEREWLRAHGRFILTNPDMLSRGILPHHRAWRQFLRRLTYVIIDECHAYRGVFGSHVAQVLRRLQRLAADPVFLLASATAGDPASAAARLTGVEVEAVIEDTSPRGAVTFVLWEPPLLSGTDGGEPTVPHPRAPEDLPQEQPVRRSALAETADLLADTASHEIRTLAFVRSRRGAELVAASAARALDEVVPGLGKRIAAYRSGYLPEERRALEQALRNGDLLGLATTNALELGVDLVGLDAVVLCGYPGRLASMWQQAGRAGRAGRDALCVLVARDDPLDTYLVHHPEALFGAPVEATVLDPANPYVLGPHLAAAAAEAPLTEADLPRFGGQPANEVLTALTDARLLRRRPTGWYWVGTGRPDIDLRGTGGQPIAVVENGSGRLLGTVDSGSAHVLLHPGAVYLHQGVSYVVDRLDLDDAVALVHPESPDWSTHARDVTDLTVGQIRSYLDAGPVGLFLGEVEVTNQVVSYQRRRLVTGEVLATIPLDLPPRQLSTVAVWCTISAPALARAGIPEAEIPGALHAAEHAAIGLLPLVATCDRWDIGGLSTALHPDTETPTIFVYDGHPGGAGFAEQAYHAAARWLSATRDAIAECPCETGCPSCVQSPKCGNGNHPLSKQYAIVALDIVLSKVTSS
jgi:DEAD/DEAH box helicase domain-containing protein